MSIEKRRLENARQKRLIDESKALLATFPAKTARPAGPGPLPPTGTRA
jgi:hypothetical protein